MEGIVVIPSVCSFGVILFSAHTSFRLSVIVPPAFMPRGI